MKRTVGVIGGGAAGMIAAVRAAKEDASVTLLEHTDRIGKKILMTGNGKCNFTNLYMDATCYYGSQPEYAHKIIEQFPVEETLRFFEELGLFYKEKNGYCYPISNQASSVLDVLRFSLKRYGVIVETEQEVSEILSCKEGGYLIKTPQKSFRFDKVILACGGKAAPKTGSDGSGYRIAKKLGHRVIKPLPALVQLKSKENYFKSISGIRMDVTLSLLLDGREYRRESGELQITDYGISGIPVFQLSRIVSNALDQQKEIIVQVDCVPDLSQKELEKMLTDKLHNSAGMCAEDAMQGFLNKKLNILFLKLSGIGTNMPAERIGAVQLEKFVSLVKGWRIRISGTNDFSQCQVCAGGVDTKELTEHCESKLHPGIYFVGELVDIDGICGGYNLQWAWSSGVVAAKAAVL